MRDAPHIGPYPILRPGRTPQAKDQAVKKVITYGTFDLLHHGHVNLLRRAKELGDYLIVGVTSSDFDKNRGKINVKQSLMDRIEAVKALGIADEVIPEEYYGQKIDDIRNYDVDIFAIGSDWRGHFDYLNEYCEVVYLDRTEGISSTQLREGGHHIALGIVGASRDIAKFIDECKYVSGVDVVGAFPDGDDFDLAGKTALFGSLEELIEASDALYVANAPERRFATAKAGLEAGKDVLSESPGGAGRLRGGGAVRRGRRARAGVSRGRKDRLCAGLFAPDAARQKRYDRLAGLRAGHLHKPSLHEPRRAASSAGGPSPASQSSRCWAPTTRRLARRHS